MKKKVLTLCLVVALAAVAIIGGTLAYFTDTTDQVDNTFTMGKVDITLDEAKVGDDGKPAQERVTENEYKDAITPGHVFSKDPTIHVAQDSQDAYVFLDVVLNKYNSLIPVMAQAAGMDDISKTNTTTDFLTRMKNDTLRAQIVDAWVDGVDHSAWKIFGVIPGDQTLTIRLGYKKTATVKAGENITFMTAFHMPANVTSEMVQNNGFKAGAFNTDAAGFKLSFKAYAVQAADIADLDAAYNAMFPDTDPKFVAF